MSQELIVLKSRLFDAEEQSKQLDQTLRSFLGALSVELELKEDQVNDLNNYINAVKALKGETKGAQA